jgi:ESF2/ABP1 family protein
MAKRNEYLDISEEENSENPSDYDEDSRFNRIRGQTAKRRKLNLTSNAASDAASDESEFSEADQEQFQKEKSNKPKDDGAPNDDTVPKVRNTEQTTSKIKALSATQLAASQRKKEKTGVIYLSRIPPFMKPSTLRHLLTPYGKLLRIFLTPEASPAYLKRVRSGGNKKKSFVDGWVEFASKKKAKICAETLNGNIIGGKKGSWYHDDIWNIKYLKGFKWDDLMEQVQNEERIREGRLRAEIQQEAKERKAFLENVERAKQERGMEAKRKKKFDAEGFDESVPYEEQNRQERTFKQNRVIGIEKDSTAAP